MAEIFLSYANEDRETAARVAALLESAGWTVWWDRRIPAGRTWRSVIEDALTEMRCMVVLWSSHSIDSHWVKEEAEEARALEKLVPVLIEPVNPPVGFRSIQAADLTDYDGSRETEGSRQLIADLESMLGKAAPKSALPPRGGQAGESIPPRAPQAAPARPVEAVEEPKPPGSSRPSVPNQRSFNWAAVGAGGAGLLLVLGAYLFWPRGDRPRAPEVITGSQSAPTPAPVRLIVRASRNQIKVGEQLSLRLEAAYGDGTTKPLAEPARWEVSDAKIASIDRWGEVKALQAGTTKVAARYRNVASEEWLLTVEAQPEPPAAKAAQPPVKAAEPAKLVALSIGNARREIRPGEKVAMRLIARFSDGSEKHMLDNVQWRTSDSSVAAVDRRGEVEALRAGRVEIRARAEGVASAPVVIRVVEAQGPASPTPAKIPEVNLRPKAPPQLPDLESLRARIAVYLNRARSYRAQGNYTGALGELEHARALDPSSAEVRHEIEQTRKACNAERSLGYNVNCG